MVQKKTKQVVKKLVDYTEQTQELLMTYVLGNNQLIKEWDIDSIDASHTNYMQQEIQFMLV